MVKARWNLVKTCSQCQRKGHVKRFCRVRARDLRKKANANNHWCMNTGAVVEGIFNTSGSSLRNVFAATNRWKRLVVIMLFNFMQNQVLALQENVESDSIIRGPDRVLTGTGKNRRIEHFGTKQVRHQLEHQTTAIDQLGRRGELVPDRVCSNAEKHEETMWSSRKIARAPNTWMSIGQR